VRGRTGEANPIVPVIAPKRGEVAAAQLRGRIIRGELKEGEALPSEAELMEQFQISRPTVREALRVLESESLIWVRRGGGGGARVRAPDTAVAAGYVGAILQFRGTTLEDVTQARAALELTAARLLARDRPAQGIELIRAKIDAELTEDGSLDRFIVCAGETHHSVVEATGNQTLTTLMALIRELASRHAQLASQYARDAAQMERNFRAAHRIHRDFLELITAGKAVEAEDLWRRHLDRSLDAMKSTAKTKVLDLFKD
jgi:GntR family transcriptional regulator, transcriptional repressor for pyruvate dehydrogenase complex